MTNAQRHLLNRDSAAIAQKEILSALIKFYDETGLKITEVEINCDVKDDVAPFKSVSLTIEP